MNTSTPKESTSTNASQTTSSLTQKEALKAKQMLEKMIAKWEEENLANEMEDLWNKGLKTRERELVEGLRGLDGLAGEAKEKECVAPLFIPALHGSSLKKVGHNPGRRERDMVSYRGRSESLSSLNGACYGLGVQNEDDLAGYLPYGNGSAMIQFSPVSPVPHQPISNTARSHMRGYSTPDPPWLTPNNNDPAWRDVGPSLDFSPPVPTYLPQTPLPSVTSPNYSPHNRVPNPRFPSSSIPDLFPFPALTPFNPR